MFGFLERLFMNKSAVGTVEKGVRKIVQYGGKSARIMDTKKKVITVFENGISAPRKMEEQMIIEGYHPIGHKEMQITDVLITGENSTNKLVLTQFKPLDGDAGIPRRTIDYIVNYGEASQYQHTVTKYADGTTSAFINI